MLSAGELEGLGEMRLDTVKKHELVDISGITVSGSPDKARRVELYLDAVRNPYLFRVGDTAVRVRYGGGSDLQSAVAGLLAKKLP